MLQKAKVALIGLLSLLVTCGQSAVMQCLCTGDIIVAVHAQEEPGHHVCAGCDGEPDCPVPCGDSDCFVVLRSDPMATPDSFIAVDASNVIGEVVPFEIARSEDFIREVGGQRLADRPPDVSRVLLSVLYGCFLI